MNAAIQFIATVILVFCCTWMQCFVLLFHLITKGRRYFTPKERTRAPDVLQDDEWNHDWIMLSEVKLHFVHDGDRSKPLIILLHGFPEFWYTWRHQIRHLRHDYFVVAVDMRGFGDSAKPPKKARYSVEKLSMDIYDLVYKLGFEKCYLVGHDWGGAVAWDVAIRYPKVVKKLVVLNAPHEFAFQKHMDNNPLSQIPKSWYMFFFQCPVLPELWMQMGDMDVLDKWLRQSPLGTTNQNSFTDEDIEAWKYTFSQPGALSPPINYYRQSCWKAPLTTPPNIQPPVLIIWGTGDAYLDKEIAQLCLEECQEAKIRWIEGASHWVQNDEPTLCNKYISEFLAE